jgi:MFS family permease
MGLATALIGLLPTYAAVGIAAPILLVTLRLVQGLALGDEYGGAATHVAEHVPDHRRGYYTSIIQTTAATLGFFVSLAVIGGTRLALGPAAFKAWGWRVPFLASFILLGVSLYIRLRMRESPLFARLKREGKVSTNPLRDSFGNKRNLKFVLLALFGATAGQGVVWYTGQFYALTFPQKPLNLDWKLAYVLVTVALALGTLGHLFDRVGRKRIMLAGCALAAMTYLPIYVGIRRLANPTLAPVVESLPWSSMVGIVALLALQMVYVAMVYGPIAAFLVELFPTSIRYTSMSLPYHLGNGWFGGVLPLIATAPPTAAWAKAAFGDGAIYLGLAYPILICLRGRAVHPRDPRAQDRHAHGLTLSLPALDAAKPQGADQRGVVHGEEVGVGGVGLVLEPGPDRDGERVALLPFDALALDQRFTATLDDVDHEALEGALGQGAASGGQTVRAAADRRQDIAAGGGVDVADRVSVVGIGRGRARQGVEGRAHVGPAVTPDRRVAGGDARTDGKQRPAVHQLTPAARLRLDLPARGVRLEEHRVHGQQHGDVEAVHPHDGAVTQVPVVVPHPARRQHEITRLHVDAAALDVGVATAPLDHEAQGAGAVAVRGRHLTRQDDLHRRVQRRRRSDLLRVARVDEHQDPALGLVRGHQFPRTQEPRPHVLPSPQIRDLAPHRLGGQRGPQDVPQRLEAKRRQLAVKCLARSGQGGAGGGRRLGGGHAPCHTMGGWGLVELDAIS